MDIENITFNSISKVESNLEESNLEESNLEFKIDINEKMEIMEKYLDKIKTNKTKIYLQKNSQKKKTQSHIVPLLVPTKNIKETKLYCEFCKQYSNISKKNIMICKLCGNEQDSYVDSTPEWHNYNGDSNVYSDPTRCGSYQHPLLKNTYVTSMEHTTDKAYKNIQRNMLWNSNCYPENSKKEIFSKLTTIGIDNNIPNNIIEYAQQLYSEIIDIKTSENIKSSRGDFLEGLIASCLGKASASFSKPIFPKDLAKMFKINESNITKGLKLFDQIILYSKNTNFDCDTTSSNSIYGNYIEEYCKLCNMTQEQIERVIKCVEIIDKHNLLPTNTPQTIICGCIYFVTYMLHLNIKKETIASICNISIATLNTIYKELINYNDLLVFLK